MKNSFYDYYPPTPEEYESLWREALIVLDTNVLLNLYRLPTTARDELINVLEVLKDRLWIPHQVALEFQRRRLTVISIERKSTADALSTASELVSEIKKKVDALQIDKRGLGIDSQPLITELDKANSQLVEAIKVVHNSQLDISSSDPIRQRLDDLLDSRVGPGPSNQSELDLLISEGEQRFKEKIPPGYMDADKDKNPNEAVFIFDKIMYQRKFGDLILWRQLIQHAKISGIKMILLVTADRKEDWWWREQGKTIGPHPELIREIKREGGVESFWMNSAAQFVEQANKYSAASVSTESVAEIQQVALFSQRSTDDLLEHMLHSTHFSDRSRNNTPERYFSERIDPRSIEECVGDWLGRHEERIKINVRGFPDFLVYKNDDVHGYEVKYLRQSDRMFIPPFPPSIINGILRGYMETKEGRIAEFTLVIVISELDFYKIMESDKYKLLYNRLGRLLKKYPIHSILVGAILGNEFEVLINCNAPIFDD